MTAEQVDELGLPSAPRIPRRFVYWAVAGAVVLAVGGTLGDHLIDGHVPALRPAASASSTSGSAASTGSDGRFAPIAAPLGRFMGLTRTAPTPAPGISLTDQRGAEVSLASLRHKVVVLSFFDAACDDICPVLGRELNIADAALAARADRVELVAVNTDPLVTSVAEVAATSRRLGLAAKANWLFLTGPLSHSSRVTLTRVRARRSHSVVWTYLPSGLFLR